MKIRCEKALLQNACSVASRAAASKSPILALEGLLLKAEEGLTVCGYDLKKAIYTEIEAEIIQRGEIVINARLFGEMVRRMPDGMVTVSVGDNYSVNVKCGRSEFNIIGMSAEDYPELPSFDAENTVSLPQKILKAMINQSLFAVSTDEIRPIYTGALFEIKDSVLTLVAVDGYRLAKRSEEIEGQLNDCSFVVPGNTLSDVEKICSQEDEDSLSISLGKKHISFAIGSTYVISRRLEGEFLNYRRSIPESFKYSLKVERAELMSVIDRVSLVISEKNTSPVRMSFNDEAIYCCCITPVGKGEDTCTCDGDGEGLLVGFNDRYLKDALKAASKDELLICVSSPSSPCVIKAADGTKNFEYMILPVRMHADR